MSSAADTVREQSNALQDAIRDRLAEAVEEVTTMASNIRSSALNLEDLPDTFEGEVYRCRYGMNGSTVPTWRAEVDCGEGLVLFMNAMSGEVDPVIAQTGRAVIRPEMLDGARVRVRRDPKEGRIIPVAILSELPREQDEPDRLPELSSAPVVGRDAENDVIRIGDLVEQAAGESFARQPRRRVVGLVDGYVDEGNSFVGLESADGDGGYKVGEETVFGIRSKNLRIVERTPLRVPLYLLDAKSEPLFVGDRFRSRGNASERTAFDTTYEGLIIGIAKSRTDGGEFRVGTLVVRREGDSKGAGTYRTGDGQVGRGVRAEYVTKL